MTRILFYILIVFFQIVLFNHLEFGRFIFPQVFIALLICMPVYWNKSVQIVAGFALGLMIDLFVYSPGLHASACTFLVLARFGLLQYVDQTNLLMDKELFTISTVGNAVFLRVMLILTVFYHAYLFLLENIGSFTLGNYLIAVFASSIFAILVILLFQAVFYRDLDASK